MDVTPGSVKLCGMIQSHAEVFRKIALERDAVLASRALNPLCESLLKEGHASKGFYIKAKSCNWGPMAGMVLVNPLFSKEKPAKQKEYVDLAIARGCGSREVFLSTNRLSELKNLGKINNAPQGADTVVDISAKGDHAAAEFRVKKNATQEPMWQLFEVSNGTEVAVLGLTNKQVPSAGVQPAGPRGVVAGDYDLFCVWSRHSNARPLGTAPRAIAGTVAKPYIAAVKAANSVPGMTEDADMGNVSFYQTTVIKQLNEGIIASGGYTGGAMIHHNDESGNPFTPGEDYPLIFFIPGQGPKAVEDARDLMSVYKECEDLGYCVERNPGFNLT